VLPASHNPNHAIVAVGTLKLTAAHPKGYSCPPPALPPAVDGRSAEE
jgi:hypothetical protein